MKHKQFKITDKQKLHWVSLSLRIGLAAVFLYAGIEALRSPEAWIGFVPEFSSNFIDPKLSLDILSYMQIVLAVVLLSGKFLKIAGLVSIGLLAGIMIFNPGTLLITFRDAGLITAAAAIIILDL